MNLRGNDRFLVTGFLAVFVGAVAAVAQPAPAAVGLDPDGWTGMTKATSRPVVGAPQEGVAFAGPGRWRHVEKLAWGDAERIRVRLHASGPGQAELAFTSGGGTLSRGFSFSAGEQVKTFSARAFVRDGGGDWHAVDGVVLEVKDKVAVTLLAVEAITGEANVPDDGRLYVGEALSRFTAEGDAWPVHAILDGDTYPPRIAPAGKTLADQLERLYGVRVPVNPDGLTPDKAAANVLLVGRAAALAAGTAGADELRGLGFNGFLVRPRHTTLTIAGNSVQGTSYGVFRYLEKNGLAFYDTDRFARVAPAERLAAAITFSDRPFFNGKRVSAPYCVFGDSSSTLSLGDARASGIDEEFPCDKTLWLDHTAAFLVPKTLYMKDHPDYYLLRANGERMGPDTLDVRLLLCSTSEGAQRVAAERAERWLDAQNERYVFVVQQGDSNDKCVCKGCAAKRAQGWNEADLMLHWVNAVARRVNRKHPDKLLYCFGYMDAVEPPNILKPEANVVVLYCPWPGPMSAPNGFRDFDAPENTFARRHLEGWLAAVGGDHLGIYDYAGGASLSHRRMADRIKWCARRGIRGGFWYCGQSRIFGKLFNYLNARLNWDPFLDTPRLERAFIRHYYGDAAEAMGAIYFGIFDRIDADLRNNGGHPHPGFFERTFVETVFARFEEAVQKAPTPAIRAEIESDRDQFVDIGVAVLAPRDAPELDDERLSRFTLFLRRKLDAQVAVLGKQREIAAKAGKPQPGWKGIADAVWGWTRVSIGGEADEALPARLRELMADPAGVIRQHRVTDFTEPLPSGMRLPAMAFSGACGPTFYQWKCEGRVAAWVRGAMTDVSEMRARFSLAGAPAGGEAVLAIDGQDSDDLTAAAAPIRITLNGQTVFEGPNGFVKLGWSKREFTFPVRYLKAGENVLTVSNTAVSDAPSSWFMLSEAVIRWP